MTVKSLWGDIDDLADIRAPHEIIAEQGEKLAEMTKGLLELIIERKETKTIFNYDIYINLPSMKQRYRIFRMTHDFNLYPANLYDEQNSNEYKGLDQAGFEENLGTILSSAQTMTSIGRLLAAARLSVKDIHV